MTLGPQVYFVPRPIGLFERFIGAGKLAELGRRFDQRHLRLLCPIPRGLLQFGIGLPSRVSRRGGHQQNIGVAAHLAADAIDREAEVLGEAFAAHAAVPVIAAKPNRHQIGRRRFLCPARDEDDVLAERGAADGWVHYLHVAAIFGLDRRRQKLRPDNGLVRPMMLIAERIAHGDDRDRMMRRQLGAQTDQAGLGGKKRGLFDLLFQHHLIDRERVSWIFAIVKPFAEPEISKARRGITTSGIHRRGRQLRRQIAPRHGDLAPFGGINGKAIAVAELEVGLVDHLDPAPTARAVSFDPERKPIGLVPLGRRPHGRGHESAAGALNEGELHRFADFAFDQFGRAGGNFLLILAGHFGGFVADGLHVEDHRRIALRKGRRSKHATDHGDRQPSHHLDSP